MSFWKPEVCSQTVLLDRSVLKGQKLVENAKIQKFKCDIFSNFQTLWIRENHFCKVYEMVFQVSKSWTLKSNLVKGEKLSDVERVIKKT